MAQPFFVEWSPSTNPADLPSWEDFPAPVFDVTWGGGRGGDSPFDDYAPGTASFSFRNGNTAGQPVALDFATFRRNTPVQISGTGGVWFTGYIIELDFDTKDLPQALRGTVKCIDWVGVWARTTITRGPQDITDDPTFPGWATTIADLAAEIDASSTVIGTPDLLGFAHAPVIIPPTVTDDTDLATKTATFTGNGLEALKKGLDVEMGNVFAGAAGELRVNGRYAVADTYAAFAGDPVYTLQLTGKAADVDWVTTFPYMRGTEKFANPYAQWHNTAATKGSASKTTHTGGTVAAGDFLDTIERLDLWCADENWVQADADLLAALYTNVRETWLTEIGVLLWDSRDDTGVAALYNLVHDLFGQWSRRLITVAVPRPDGIPTTFLCTVEGMTVKVNSAQAVATLKLGVAARRWSTAYDLSVGIFALDVAGRGLDSGAILGP